MEYLGIMARVPCRSTVYEVKWEILDRAVDSQATVLYETEKDLWLIPCGRQSVVSYPATCRPQECAWHVSVPICYTIC